MAMSHEYSHNLIGIIKVRGVFTSFLPFTFFRMNSKVRNINSNKKNIYLFWFLFRESKIKKKSVKVNSGSSSEIPIIQIF